VKHFFFLALVTAATAAKPVNDKQLVRWDDLKLLNLWEQQPDSARRK
jgi:hypothetical protein